MTWVTCLSAMALALSVTACQRQREVHSVDDLALVNTIRTAFAADHDTQGATTKVEVHAKDGIVTLSGTADTEVDKALAEQVARRTKGVVSVVNQIVVTEPQPANPESSFDEKAVREQAAKSGERIGPSSDDARIYNAVRQKLVEHSGTSKSEILVDVENRNVTLRGRFVGTSTARDEAIAAARAIKGVNAVNDRLTVYAGKSRP